MVKVLVLYYSSYGHIEQMAEAVAEGAREALHNTGRLAWGSGPRGEKPDYTGLDVVIVRDDKIAALYVFLDPMPS